MWSLIVPDIVLVVVGVALFIAERRFPGRELPPSQGWYWRALLFNLSDVIVLTVIGIIFHDFFREHSIFAIRNWNSAILELAVIWPAWSFVFYWWHRAAHLDGLWHIFHQMHDSPSRIEVVTTFYKHPAEAVFETLLTALIIYLFFGASPLAGAWLGAVISMVGFFSHCNLRTPLWMGYIIQRPEQHSIHHQYDLHRYNYADFILWDRLFGTFREATRFTERCGFPRDHERRVREMLQFKDVYKE
jgi:sterol desaturase/sphingolipid hydroxylase (fatty acid hydroxylase superfamily)